MAGSFQNVNKDVIDFTKEIIKTLKKTGWEKGKIKKSDFAGFSITYYIY